MSLKRFEQQNNDSRNFDQIFLKYIKYLNKLTHQYTYILQKYMLTKENIDHKELGRCKIKTLKI